MCKNNSLVETPAENRTKRSCCGGRQKHSTTRKELACCKSVDAKDTHSNQEEAAHQGTSDCCCSSQVS